MGGSLRGAVQTGAATSTIESFTTTTAMMSISLTSTISLTTASTLTVSENATARGSEDDDNCGAVGDVCGVGTPVVFSKRCCGASKCEFTHANSSAMKCTEPAVGLLGQSPQSGGGRVVLRPGSRRGRRR